MRIAASAVEPNLDTDIDPRFGRCHYFILVNPETMEFETVENYSAAASGGAGISAAQLIADKVVDVVLTGNCGPNAHQVLSAASIQVFTGISGKVRDAIHDYKSSKLKSSSLPNVPDHFGMGRHMGKGKDRDMQRKTATGFDITSTASTVLQPQKSELGINSLGTQLQTISEQLSSIQQRIGELENKRK
jgi:predicted Fe-Mo cluster-binding NifX family protein